MCSYTFSPQSTLHRVSSFGVAFVSCKGFIAGSPKPSCMELLFMSAGVSCSGTQWLTLVKGV